MRGIYRALSIYWLLRAATRGPGGFLRYLIRRQIRRSVYRSLNRLFRVSGLYGRRR
jgi:hypothetical protein